MSRVERASVNEWGRASEVWARFQGRFHIREAHPEQQSLELGA